MFLLKFNWLRYRKLKNVFNKISYLWKNNQYLNYIFADYILINDLSFSLV